MNFSRYNKNDSTKRDAEEKSLSDILENFISSKNIKKGYDKIESEKAWYAVMGRAISKYTSGVMFSNNTLYVYLSSSTMREQLSYEKQKMITLLNEYIGREIIKKVILR